MKNSSLLVASIACLAAAPAHAALTIDLSLPSGSFQSPNVFCAGAAPCSFTEMVTFTTPSPFNLVAASITTIALGVGSTSDINFTSVLLNGNAFTLTSALGGALEGGGLANSPFLAPGAHTLSVSGISHGTGLGSDGSYSGTFTFAAADGNNGAVPEPATWLSMIMGFGAMGFAMRNRTQQSRRAKFNFALNGLKNKA